MKPSRRAFQGSALITGGARRLGRAMALGLARRGLDVVIHYNQSQQLAADLVDEIKAMGQKSGALQADLMDERATRSLVQQACETLGTPLHLLINNAAIFERDDISSASHESWSRHMVTNYWAPFILTQEFARQAPPCERDEEGEGIAAAAIINIVDECIAQPTSDFTTYTLSKMGLWSLTRVSARSLAPDIRVNAIGPGPTLKAKRQSLEHFRHQRAHTPLRRSSSLSEVVSALTFLLDSPSVTGQLILLDGGKNFLSKGLENKQF